MFGSLYKKFKDFTVDQRGGVAFVFAIAVFMIVLAAGLAIDYGRGVVVQNRILHAVDAAALAAARLETVSDMEDEVERVFAANFGDSYFGSERITPIVSYNPTTRVVSVSASTVMPTAFMRIVGQDTMDVGAASEVTTVTNPLDIVIAIDVSGSMRGSRITAARAAANELVDHLFGTAATSSQVLIGMVPFSGMVNIATGGVFTTATSVAEANFTSPVTGNLQSETFLANNSPVPLLNEPPSDWQGCVFQRYVDGAAEADQADDNIGPGTFGTAEWLGWQVPSEEDSSCPPTKTKKATKSKTSKKKASKKKASKKKASKKKASKKKSSKKKTSKSKSKTPHTVCGYTDTSTYCPRTPVTPLTNSKSVITTAIAALDTSDSTNMAQGMSWAWQLVNNAAPFTEASPTGAANLRKAIILLSDGLHWGYPDDGYKGIWGTGTSARAEMDARMQRIADAARAQGIEIYAIQFETVNADLQAILKSTADKPIAPFYQFAADGASLSEAFKEIGGNLKPSYIQK